VVSTSQITEKIAHQLHEFIKPLLNVKNCQINNSNKIILFDYLQIHMEVRVLSNQAIVLQAQYLPNPYQKNPDEGGKFWQNILKRPDAYLFTLKNYQNLDEQIEFITLTSFFYWSSNKKINDENFVFHLSDINHAYRQYYDSDSEQIRKIM
jgi:hypothetical protein